MEFHSKVMLCGMFYGQIRKAFEEEEDSGDDEIVVSLMVKNQGRPVRIARYIENVVHKLNSAQFRQHFRMSRTTFSKLLSIYCAELIPERRPFSDMEKQLLSVMWLLANQESFSYSYAVSKQSKCQLWRRNGKKLHLDLFQYISRSVSERFAISKSTLHLFFVRVINVLNKIAPKVIKWPGSDARIQIKRIFSQYGLENVIGAVDGTYIRIKAPKENAQRYVNRKLFKGITLQAITDHSLKFIDCFAGYPSSVSDRRIFVNSDIYKSIEENPNRYFQENEYILGDKAYPVKKWILPPYIDRGSLRSYEINFNTQHARTRQVVERSFALLFGRFRRLKFVDMVRTDLIPKTILACCVLHNICLDFETIATDFIQEGVQEIHSTDRNQPINPQVVDNLGEGISRRDIIALELFRESNN